MLGVPTFLPPHFVIIHSNFCQEEQQPCQTSVKEYDPLERHIETYKTSSKSSNGALLN